MQTVSGTFADRRTAQRAVDALLARGFTRASVHLQTGATSDPPEREAAPDRGMMASVGSFFSRLFESGAKDHAGSHVETVGGDSSVVAVDTSDDSEVQTAESVMGQLGTINGDARAMSVDLSAPGLSDSDPANRKS